MARIGIGTAVSSGGFREGLERGDTCLWDRKDVCEEQEDKGKENRLANVVLGKVSEDLKQNCQRTGEMRAGPDENRARSVQAFEGVCGKVRLVVWVFHRYFVGTKRSSPECKAQTLLLSHIPNQELEFRCQGEEKPQGI